MSSQPHFLAHIFSENHFTREELQQIFSRFSQVHFPKQAYLQQEGKTAQHYWFVAEGFVRAYVIGARGNDISTHFYTTGDIVIDWSSLFLRQPARERIQALTDCTCWQISFAAFQELFHGIPAFREQGRTNLAASYFELKSRSLSVIADPAIERYRRLLQEKPHILQHVPLKHIATYLGITDTSFSRIRKELSGA